MKKTSVKAWILLLAVLLAAAGCEKKDDTGKGPALGDEVWIKVNGQGVMKSEITKEVDRTKKMLGNQYPPELIAQQEPQIKRESMQRAVQKSLLDQEVKKEGITVSEEEVTQEIDKFKSMFPEQGDFEAKLAELEITEEEVREDVLANLGYQALIDKKASVADPTEDEIKFVYEQSKSRLIEPGKVVGVHILLAVPPSGGEEEKKQKKELAASLLKKIKAGEDIKKLAAEHSEAPSKAESGVETFTQGQMPEDFDLAVFELEAGELSPVIETPVGYHIVKVTEKIEERTTPLEDVKDEIKEYLVQQAKNEAAKNYVDELMKDAEIEYIEPLPEMPPPPMMPGMMPMPSTETPEDSGGTEQ